MRCEVADNFIGNRACALYNRRMQTALDTRQKDLAIEMLYGHFFWSKRSWQKSRTFVTANLVQKINFKARRFIFRAHLYLS